MSIRELGEIKELKKFYDLPIDEIVYFKSDGQLHGQIIYNICNGLKVLINTILDLQKQLDNKEDKIDVNNIKEVTRLNG